MPPHANIKKIILAYSGGLDTSVILAWLQETYGCAVVAFIADVGQGDDLDAARKKALACGAADVVVADLREVFVRDYVFPMLRANALYEGQYLLGTAIARPVIAKAQIEVAERLGADAVSHGATGKGNDQIRFELAYYALSPDIRVIAPWREWSFVSRGALLTYARARQIPVADASGDAPPFSVDENLLHRSCEGKALEDPANEAPAEVWQNTCAPEAAPDAPAMIEIGFEAGDAVSVDGAALKPHAVLARLNELGGAHGVGRADIVENRATGMKSRGVYETPGGTILRLAHHALEQITLDAEAAHLKAELMPRYARLVYDGLWFSPEREMLQALVDAGRANATGRVRVRLYKGQAFVVGRDAPRSLYSRALASFDEASGYDPRDAEGFIKLNALRFRNAKAR